MIATPRQPQSGQSPIALRAPSCTVKRPRTSRSRAARSCDLPLSVRGGGHDWAGRALCDGLVIDLSGLNRVDLYLENGTASVGGGTRASGLLEAIEPFGLAA